ncbi:MAG: C2 family cysteine protease [Thermoguttaceae bacterium]|jgi:hypothetical protein
MQYQIATTSAAVNVNHPAAATAYSPISGTLFSPNGPSYLDVQQGYVGGCWLLASLAEVAARYPQDIRSMFTAAGTTVENGATVSLYTVRFFNSVGVAEYVTVDTELPSGGTYYDQPVNGVLWVALAEKAYAEANGAGSPAGRIRSLGPGFAAVPGSIHRRGAKMPPIPHPRVGFQSSFTKNLELLAGALYVSAGAGQNSSRTIRRDSSACARG